MSEEIRTKLFVGNNNFCGTSMMKTAAGQTCRWPQREITYYENMSVSGLSRAEIVRAFDEAFQMWGKVCNISPRRVDSKVGANIYSEVGRIDGPWGVVGQSYIPCGVSSTSQLGQVYDSSETWTFSMFKTVVLHELGHAIGFQSHLSGRNIMAPSLSDLTELQSGDIAFVQGIYGPPVDIPPPLPPFPPPPVPPTLSVIPNGQFLSYPLAAGEIKVFNFTAPRTWFGVAKSYMFMIKEENQTGFIMALYNTSGNLIGSNSKGRFTVRLKPGPYVLHVRLIDMTRAGSFKLGTAKV